MHLHVSIREVASSQTCDKETLPHAIGILRYDKLSIYANDYVPDLRAKTVGIYTLFHAPSGHVTHNPALLFCFVVLVAVCLRQK